VRYIWIGVALLAAATAAEPPQKAKKKAVAAQSVTGCMDEKPEVYVIRSDDALKELVQLEPVGFEKAIFARYVGHKVTISGQLITSTDPPTLKVSSPANIKQIADICAPAEPK
jgi:hypothetical protein